MLSPESKAAVEAGAPRAFDGGDRIYISRRDSTHRPLGNEAELEAVLAHELTHIINNDSRLMVVAIIFIGMLGFAAQLVRQARNGVWRHRPPCGRMVGLKSWRP